MSSPHANVLRNVSMHAQPHALTRPRGAVNATSSDLRGAREPAAFAASASASASASMTAGHGGAGPASVAGPREGCDADTAGYAEGIARGRADGHRAGFAEGVRDAQARVDEAVRRATGALETEAGKQRDAAAASHAGTVGRLEQLSSGFEQAAAERLAALEGDAVALAFEAVCQLIGEPVASADRVAGAVDAALQKLRGAPLLRVRVHPDDLGLLRGSAVGQALLQRTESTEWVADSQLASGGCVLDSERGGIDARMETQLERLRCLWAERATSHR